MDKNWVDEKIKEAETMFLKIKRIFQEQEIIPPNATEKILNEIRKADNSNCYFNFDLVVGHGINKITGEPINFVGRQTGL